MTPVLAWFATLDWNAILQIILIDILLGGDNAVIIALACRNLPARQRRVGIDQLRTQPLVAAPDSEEPATAHAVRALLDDPGRLPGTITRARDVHTTVGLAACGVGVGLLPSCARSAARPDTWIAEVDPPVRLPDLVLAFRADDRSPVLEAFLATVAVHCPGTGQHLRQPGRARWQHQRLRQRRPLALEHLHPHGQGLGHVFLHPQPQRRGRCLLAHPGGAKHPQ